MKAKHFIAAAMMTVMAVGGAQIAKAQGTEPDIKPEWKLERMIHSCHNENVYVYKDVLYNELFTRTLGWNGGDGVTTTMLPDGNVYWSFNDSFWGTVNPTTRARGASTFPRNTVMVQKKGPDGFPGTTDEDLVWMNTMVQTSNPSAPGYYQGRTHFRHPKAKKTDAQIEAGEIDSDFLYWAGDATVYDGKMYMIWNGVNTSGTDEPAGKCLATYSLEGTPGDGTYMTVIDADYNYQNVERDAGGYGAMWEDEDGHTYVYGTDQQKENEGDLLGYARTLVARMATHDPKSAWEYYIKGEDGQWRWQPTHPTSAETKRSNITDFSMTSPWVIKKGDWYYVTGQEFVFSKSTYILRGRHPWGPFSEKRQLFTVSYVLDKKGPRTYMNVYMLNLHPALSREGELVFSTNTEADDFWKNFNNEGSADYYRPFFYRIYNWESLWDDVDSK